MTHDPKAPLPDDVEKSLSNVACGAADYSDCTVLRAHIAALEAENKRLREALEELARLGGSNGEYGNSIGNQIAKAALAQTGEK